MINNRDSQKLSDEVVSLFRDLEIDLKDIDNLYSTKLTEAITNFFSDLEDEYERITGERLDEVDPEDFVEFVNTHIKGHATYKMPRFNLINRVNKVKEINMLLMDPLNYLKKKVPIGFDVKSIRKIVERIVYR